MMVNATAGPVQPAWEGVTKIVAVCGAATTAEVKLRLPTPAAPRPMAVLSFVHV